ncbi:transporter, partial [bacterium]|nr:transporter [bacterium]
MKYDLEQKHSSSRTFDLIHTPPWTLRFATLLFVTLSVFLVLLFIIPWQQTSMGSGRVVAYSPTER